MLKIGLLIPEFPGQTHAFFIREREELHKLDVITTLISTRLPSSGIAVHSWANELAAQTSYLGPFSLQDLILAGIEIMGAGPYSWGRVFKQLGSKNDISFYDKFKHLGLLFAGAKLKRLARKKQLNHIHIHSFANAANVGMYSHLLGGPTYSATLHGPLNDYGPNQHSKWEHAVFAIIITKDLATEVKKSLNTTFLPPLFLAPMGVDIDNFKRAASYIPPKINDVTLVSCGRINYVKGHDDLIRVVALLKKKGITAHLRICGATDTNSDTSGYYESLISLAKELVVSDQVRFLGSISETAIKKELENCHFFCLASLHEPLGVATMEAMSMEVPTIVTSSPGVLEMVTHNHDGILVEPRSPAQFAQAIADLIDDPATLINLSKNARVTISEKFISSISASKIVEGVKSISGGNN
jgi:colanic acid/amylovoran biosynthesis glycosyltransferase